MSNAVSMMATIPDSHMIVLMLYMATMLACLLVQLALPVLVTDIYETEEDIADGWESSGEAISGT